MKVSTITMPSSSTGTPGADRIFGSRIAAGWVLLDALPLVRNRRPYAMRFVFALPELNDERTDLLEGSRTPGVRSRRRTRATSSSRVLPQVGSVAVHSR